MPTNDDILAALSQLPCFIVLHSLEGRMVWASRFAYGLDGSSIIGQASDVVIFDDDKPAWWEAFRRVQYLRETVSFAVRVHTPAPPGLLRLSGRLGPIIQNDAVRWVVAVTNDVTSHDPPLNPLQGFILTPLCRAIVSLLLPNGAMKGATIAKRLGETDGRGQASSRLRVVLASLCERNVLTLTRQGYKISGAFLPHAAKTVRPNA